MWAGRLRSQYRNFSEFESYAEIYLLHTRLGFETPEDAWEANPIVQGSVNPADYRQVKEPDHAT